MMAALEIRDLVVRYGPVLALDGVTVDVRAGTVTGLLGMNGSGKSSLFKAVVGTLRPDHGQVTIDGHSPAAARRQGLVGYVPQSEVVDWAFPLTVRDVVMMGRYGRLGITRRPRPADRSAVEQALERVELTAYADRQIGQLSGGQRKRAFVARGQAQEASVLLLDEPFAGVDKGSEATIVAVLRRLAREGRTVLVSTHDLQALPQLADEAILLMRRVLFHGPVAEVLRPERLALAFGLDPASLDPASPAHASRGPASSDPVAPPTADPTVEPERSTA